MSKPRCDFVLTYADTGYVRIHPGTTPRQDAKLRFFQPPVLLSPAQQWATLVHGNAFTVQSAMQ
eukprot:11314962-Heterocapsa_arctica.AAC.1